jgi:hypothetical protein
MGHFSVTILTSTGSVVSDIQHPDSDESDWVTIFYPSGISLEDGTKTFRRYPLHPALKS